ncbi:MAG: aromatic-ring-hydroxylating dioxygenase subunit beta [Chloroflexota bacterium]
MISQPQQTSTVTREEIENFLYDEAALLDEWRLDAWMALFTEDCRYVVPTTDEPQGEPWREMVLIDDDRERLQGRVNRLKSRHAHREFPWSRTRRMISNVRVLSTEGDEVLVTANFIVYRTRNEQTHPMVGRYDYRLRHDNGSFKIAHRRATLDQEAMRDHGAVSIIL